MSRFTHNTHLEEQVYWSPSEEAWVGIARVDGVTHVVTLWDARTETDAWSCLQAWKTGLLQSGDSL